MAESQSEHDVDAVVTMLVSEALDAAVAQIVLASGRSGNQDYALMPAMKAVCARLGVHLTRWVGADGWRALLRRGLDEAVRRGGATGLSQDSNGDLRWTDEASLALARSGCVQVLVGVTRVLARFIGDEMAVRLIEQGVARDDSESGQGSDHG